MDPKRLNPGAGACACASAGASAGACATASHGADPLEYVDEFVHHLRVLVRDLAKRYPSDATVFRAQKRAMTAIAIDPLFVVKTVGPYLYDYRGQIYNLNDEAEAFFLENDFDAELKAGVDQEKVDMVSYIIPKAKECARTLPPNEKEEYKALVVAMLDSYIEYLAAAAEKR